jgi:beta-mannanase
LVDIVRRPIRWFTLLVASCVTASLAVAMSAGPVSAAPLLPSTGAFFGALVQPRGDENASEAIRRAEEMIGRRYDIDHQFYSWNDQIPTWVQRHDVDAGRIPLINWFAGSSNGDAAEWGAIANGQYDDWIGERADAFVEFGAPIFVAFHHEPEDDQSRFGSPEEYAAAFRHIVDIFRSRGATNVGWVFNITARSFRSASGPLADRFYPGDDYVDVIGADGYNWAPGDPGTNWVSFEEIFTSVNGWATAHAKPWIVAEYGVQEDPSVEGRKAQWLLDALVTIKSWPQLKGVVYFDKNKRFNWLTDTSQSAADAYRTMGQDPHMNQSSAPPLPPQPLPLFGNGLNGGPDGASIGNGNGSGHPFDSVTVTDGARLVFDDDKRPYGRFSAKHILPSGPADSYYRWDGERQRWYGRIYVRLKKLPPDDLRLVRARSAGDLSGSINISSAGTLVFMDRDNIVVMKTSRALVPRHWVRIEWVIDHSLRRATIMLFNQPNSRVATDVVSVRDIDIGFSADEYDLGRSGNENFAFTFWTDGPAISSDGFLGPIRSRPS